LLNAVDGLVSAPARSSTAVVPTASDKLSAATEAVRALRRTRRRHCGRR